MTNNISKNVYQKLSQRKTNEEQLHGTTTCVQRALEKAFATKITNKLLAATAFALYLNQLLLQIRKKHIVRAPNISYKWNVAFHILLCINVYTQHRTTDIWLIFCERKCCVLLCGVSIAIITWFIMALKIDQPSICLSFFKNQFYHLMMLRNRVCFVWLPNSYISAIFSMRKKKIHLISKWSKILSQERD